MIDIGAANACEVAAQKAVDDVLAEVEGLTTVSVERATARLLGVEGDQGGIPTANFIVDTAKELEKGVSRGWTGIEVDEQMDRNVNRLERRQALRESYPPAPDTMRYVLTATGDVDCDVTHALAVAEAGGDIIAVIRSTAQSLLDYVPEGLTHEGYGGTFATQANFRQMRAALDEWSEENGRYVRLSSFASGLCMPEISALGALEGLDNMVNDCMYGILYRDINPVRTMVDQLFSRRINSWAGIVINTGEDNYPRTADGIDCMPSVVASWYINYLTAKHVGMRDELIGLGLAFEVDPAVRNSFLFECAHATLLRELFPSCPVKYMPPTRHMTGDMWRTQSVDAMFNLVTAMINPGIQTIGVPSEGIHTPHIQDRVIGMEAVRYASNAAADLGREVTFRNQGAVHCRTLQVQNEAVRLLERIAEDGFFESVAAGVFGDVKRPRDGGRGADGVIEKDPLYVNGCEGWMRVGG